MAHREPRNDNACERALYTACVVAHGQTRLECRTFFRGRLMPDTPRRTGLLIVLDGFGYRAETDGNAIAAAHAPTWNELWRTAPHTLISGSGHDVGLPAGQMGNSEVGHMNLGAGRVVYQDLTRISLAIETGEFAHNAALNSAIDAVKPSGA